jgi:Mg-chelatase subunit ChlD
MRAILLCAGLVCLSSSIIAAPIVVGNGLVLTCSQPVSGTLRCDYRLTTNGRPLAASAAIGEVALPNPTFATRTGAPASVAVLLLVDTSDPARAPAIKKIREHIARLVNDAEPHLRFGLAAFDSDLEMLAPIGSDIDSLVVAANGLSAKGRTTELYRNVVRALDLLATATDEHKVLMVLSDGLAEDRA